MAIREIPEASPRVNRPNPFTSIPLMERDHEFTKLLHSALERRPTLVCGAPGLGKTRLLLELKSELIKQSVRYRFLEKILYVDGMTVIGSAVHPHTVGALHRVFWNQQEVINLRGLSKQASSELIQKASQLFNLHLPDTSTFQEQVAHAARGNPGRIIDMCNRAADPTYRDGDRIRFAALSIDSFARLVP